MSGNCELGRGLRRREKNANKAGAGRFEKPTPDARARSSRDSRVAHQPEDRCRSVIDRAILFPTLISILAVAATTPSWITIGAAGLMGMSVWLPQRIIEKVPGHQLLQVLIWSGVAAVLLTAIRRRLRCQQACPTD